jgi:hypothetical protein
MLDFRIIDQNLAHKPVWGAGKRRLATAAIFAGRSGKAGARP